MRHLCRQSYRKSLLVFPLFLFFAVCSASTDLEDRVQRVEKGLLPPVFIAGRPLKMMELKDRMVIYKIPAVSIAVINKGRLEWAKAYGEGTTTETLFQAGSISKPLAAIAALILVEQGTLDLDEDVNLRLRLWKIPEREFTRKKRVTLRGLLSHSAGLGVHGFNGYGPNDPLPSLLQILDGMRPANSAPIRMEFVPGSKYQYSGGGYVVLQQLLFDITGKRFPEFVNSLVFAGLAMKHSTFAQPLPKDWSDRVAKGHLDNGAQVKGGWNTYPEMAAAGLWSTPSDLASLAIEIQASYEGKSDRLLKPETTRQMLSRVIADQGLGWELAGEGDSARFFHAGDTVGYKALLVAYKVGGRGAVAMTDGDNGQKLAEEIMRSIAKEYEWPGYLPKEKIIVPVNPAILQKYVGQYSLEIAPQIKIIITVENGKLMLEVKQPTGDEKSEILPESDTQFFAEDSDFLVTFSSDGLMIHQKGDEYRAKRLH